MVKVNLNIRHGIYIFFWMRGIQPTSSLIRSLLKGTDHKILPCEVRDIFIMDYFFYKILSFSNGVNINSIVSVYYNFGKSAFLSVRGKKYNYTFDIIQRIWHRIIQISYKIDS